MQEETADHCEGIFLFGGGGDGLDSRLCDGGRFFVVTGSFVGR